MTSPYPVPRFASSCCAASGSRCRSRCAGASAADGLMRSATTAMPAPRPGYLPPGPARRARCSACLPRSWREGCSQRPSRRHPMSIPLVPLFALTAAARSCRKSSPTCTGTSSGRGLAPGCAYPCRCPYAVSADADLSSQSRKGARQNKHKQTWSVQRTRQTHAKEQGPKKNPTSCFMYFWTVLPVPKGAAAGDSKLGDQIS